MQMAHMAQPPIMLPQTRPTESFSCFPKGAGRQLVQKSRQTSAAANVCATTEHRQTIQSQKDRQKQDLEQNTALKHRGGQLRNAGHEQ